MNYSANNFAFNIPALVAGVGVVRVAVNILVNIIMISLIIVLLLITGGMISGLIG